MTIRYRGIAILLVACAGALMFGLASPASAQTGDSGNRALRDPADFNTRAEIRNEYQDLQGGGHLDMIVPRLDYAVSGVFSLRLETPIVSANPNVPGNDGEAGIGDLLVRASYRALRGEGFAVVVGSEFIFDTASKDSLGFGKDVIAPLAFASIDMPRVHSVFFPFIQHYITVGGDGSRPDVHYTSIKPIWLTRWPDRFYTVVEPQFIIDHVRADRLGLTLEGEVGHVMNRNLALWGRPGLGLYGDNLPQVYNWSLQFGVRYIFN